MNASANAARRIYLCEKDGPLFFKFLKENHGWKTANIKLHGSVYCTDTFVSKKQARINENFFTKLDFVDQVNADQARFRSKIERFHKWCRGSESSSDDDDEKENEVTTVAGCGEDVDETKSHSSQSTVVTPQQPPKKRGRASDAVPRTAMSATTTAVRQVKTAARAERPKQRGNTRTPTPLVSRQTNNNVPARTKALPSDTEAELLLNVRTYASELCEALTRLVERRINWRTLLQDKNVLVDVTTRNIEEIVAVVKRYDNNKQERSIGGALAQIEAQLKALAAAGTGRPFVEEDENVARVLLELLDSVLDKAVGSSGTSGPSRAHRAPAQTASDAQTEKQSSNSRLPTEARTWGHQLCNVLQVVVEQRSRRHSLERDSRILTDVTNGNIEAIVDAVKRSGGARSIGEALVFIEKALQTGDNARSLFVQRDMELLQRLRKLLRRLFCP